MQDEREVLASAALVVVAKLEAHAAGNDAGELMLDAAGLITAQSEEIDILYDLLCAP